MMVVLNCDLVNSVNGTKLSTRGATLGRRGNNTGEDSQTINMRTLYHIELGMGRDQIEFGTWKVRTMNRRGKLENARIEMENRDIDILGICETR